MSSRIFPTHTGNQLMKLLFVHGWGCGPEIWNSVLQQLGSLPENQSLETTCLDFGFFGPAHLPSGHFDIAIGHSFGFLWLLEQQHLTFDHLLSINGFSRFFADQEFSFGTSRRVVDRMIKKLEVSPASVLSDFVSFCGAASLAQDFPDSVWLEAQEKLNHDRQRLNWGLQGLNNWDYRAQLEGIRSKNCSLRSLASSNDRVVTKQLTEACFGPHETNWHPTDCHLLPLMAPQTCTETIQGMIQETITRR